MKMENEVEERKYSLATTELSSWKLLLYDRSNCYFIGQKFLLQVIGGQDGLENTP